MCSVRWGLECQKSIHSSLDKLRSAAVPLDERGDERPLFCKLDRDELSFLSTSEESGGGSSSPTPKIVIFGVGNELHLPLDLVSGDRYLRNSHRTRCSAVCLTQETSFPADGFRTGDVVLRNSHRRRCSPRMDLAQETLFPEERFFGDGFVEDR